MRKNLTFLVLLLTSLNVFSQSKLESVGFSTISVKPDIGVLTLIFNSIKGDIRSAVENLNNETSQATRQIEKIKLQNMSQSTQNFSVRPNMIYDKGGKMTDSGYIASQIVQVRFDNSKENISRIINSFSINYGNLNFHFSFEASDSLKASVENRILELATQDAIKKAETLARSSNHSLGKIIEIRHGTIPFTGVPQMGLGGELNEIVIRGNSQGFEAKELSFSDKVLVIFEMQ